MNTLSQSITRPSQLVSFKSVAWLTRNSNWAFGVSWLTILAISIYDTYLVHVYKPVILYVESNPICLVLIRWDPQQLLYFTTAKIAGTVLVLFVLWLLATVHRRIGGWVAAGVTVFQILLLLYLTCATPPFYP